MTIRQMIYFRSICKTLNLTKSAEELYVSQPTLSLTIKELETETGTALFQKNGNRLDITDAGRTLLDEISLVLKQYEQLEEVIHSGGLTHKYLRFGFSTIVGNTMAPLICNQFMIDHPEIQMFTTEGYGDELLAKLENNKLDIVLTGGTYFNQKDWEGKFNNFDLSTSTIVFCVKKGSRLTQLDKVTLKDIADEPCAMLKETFPIQKIIERYFSERNLAPNVVLRSSQMYTVERFVTLGVAGGFLPKSSAETNNEIVQIHCEELKDLKEMPTKLYWKKSNNSKLIDSFIASAKKVY